MSRLVKPEDKALMSKIIKGTKTSTEEALALEKGQKKALSEAVAPALNKTNAALAAVPEATMEEIWEILKKLTPASEHKRSVVRGNAHVTDKLAQIIQKNQTTIDRGSEEHPLLSGPKESSTSRFSR